MKTSQIELAQELTVVLDILLNITSRQLAGTVAKAEKTISSMEAMEADEHADPEAVKLIKRSRERLTSFRQVAQALAQI
jgi:hypothetical protein